MQPLLEVKNLKKYFHTPYGNLHAVDDINLRIMPDTTLGVVGESGCGKTTLGRTILHLLEPTDGKLIFKDKDITHVNKKKFKELRKEMQIIFQDPFSSLNPRMTVSDIIGEPLQIYKIFNNKQALNKRVRELMNLVGLASRYTLTYPHELDGGRRQRIGIARALALNPDFIVCDEPVSALDVSIQAQILNLMQDLQEELGLTYMFITHDLSVVKHISRDILVMYLGKMVEYAESERLFQNPLHPYTQALLSSIPTLDIDHKVERILLRGEISSPIEPKPGCRFAPRCDRAMDICFRENPKEINMGEGHIVACHLYCQ